jgi:hypothetical protein
MQQLTGKPAKLSSTFLPWTPPMILIYDIWLPTKRKNEKNEKNNTI